MVPDHACVPGLDRPVSLSEYAKLEGLREADVLAVVGQLKIPAAFFRGQWFVEAPPNCEARLAQLRGSEMPRRDPISQSKPVRAPVPQPASDTQETPRPQPVEYGLTYDDLNLYDNLRT